MYRQDYNPTGSVVLSTIVAAIPILVLLYFIAIHPHRDERGAERTPPFRQLEDICPLGERHADDRNYVKKQRPAAAGDLRGRGSTPFLGSSPSIPRGKRANKARGPTGETGFPP